MATTPLSVEQVLTLLAQTAPRIAALTDGLAPSQLQAAPGPDDWSANDVLAHLRACADVWGDCIAAIIAEDRPTLRAVNPRTWIRRTDYREQDFPSSLQAFTAQRTQLLALLAPLDPAAWTRGATIIGAGAPLERTVLSYADWLAHHERPHLKQIARIVAAKRA